MSPLPGPNLSNVPEISARALISSLERDHVKTETRGERERIGEREKRREREREKRRERERNGERGETERDGRRQKRPKHPPSFSPFSEDFTWKALIFDRRSSNSRYTHTATSCMLLRTDIVSSISDEERGRERREEGERREERERRERREARRRRLGEMPNSG